MCRNKYTVVTGKWKMAINSEIQIDQTQNPIQNDTADINNITLFGFWYFGQR